MKFIASCSILGLVAGVLAAKSIQPAQACSCADSNPEVLDLALMSVVVADTDGSAPDAELDRWSGTLNAEQYLPGQHVWLTIDAGGDALTTLRFESSTEEAP